jgi:hypothetical protein
MGQPVIGMEQSDLEGVPRNRAGRESVPLFRSNRATAILILVNAPGFPDNRCPL